MADGCFYVVAVASALLTLAVSAHNRQPPHIVVILADDLGWNDVGFHGSDQIPTPNIDALAYNGVILNNHYTPPLCTPSRSAFMTGKYPIHNGMQHLVIFEAEPRGLPLEERLLPEYLREAGYRTHAIGKWHLGFFQREYTPTYRGFDSHYGYYQGFQDYYNHMVKATFLPFEGYDMRRNLSVDWSARGRYSTDVFTEEAVRVIEHHDPRSPMFLYFAHLAPHAGTTRDPFQAPDEEVARFPHIKDPERRVYAGMVSRLDHSVGEVVAALRAKHMLDNSIIVFMSDNGAPTHGIHSNRGSNFPLRGIKETPWEGGVRTVSAIWSPLIQKRQRVSSQLIHMADWLPTLYSAAGRNVSDLGEIDGVDMWESLVTATESPRSEFVYNIDDVGDVYAAIRYNDWKYLKGNVHKGIADDWYGETGREEVGVEYEIDSVLSSKTAVSLAGYTTKQQIHQKHQPRNTTEKEGQWELVTKEVVLRMRGEAQLRCTEPVVSCRPQDSPCLFNIRQDPCERRNMADLRPDVLSYMETLLHRYREAMVPASNLPNDPLGDPALWNHTWEYWQDLPDHLEQDGDQGVYVSGPQLLREVITTASILVSMVILVTLVLRLSPHAALVFKLPFSPAEEKRKRHLASPHEPAEKANLTYNPSTPPPPY